MNWTEGNLARHSRGRKGKEVVLRQKEYFAKARSRLLNANVKISPPSVFFSANPRQASSPAPGRSSKSALPVSLSPRERCHDDGPPQSSAYFRSVNLELPTPAFFRRHQTEEDVMGQKRRRLLLKGDWVGTSVQKPIEMEFSKHRELQGGPWDASRSRRQASRQRFRNLLGIKHGDGQIRSPGNNKRITTPIPRRRIIVRVGSRERALGGSSNGSPRSRSYCSHYSGTKEFSHISKHPDRRLIYPQDEDIIASHRSVCESDGLAEEHILKTSPVLIHPKPFRPAIPQLLTMSSNSEDIASDMAQVGIDHPVVPPCQKDENEIWRTFVSLPEGKQMPSDLDLLESQYSHFEMNISPGVSQIGQQWQDHVSEKHEEKVEPYPSHLMQGVEESTCQSFTDLIGLDTATMANSDSVNQREHDSILDDTDSKIMDVASSRADDMAGSFRTNASGTQSEKPADFDGMSLSVVPSSPDCHSENNTLGHDNISVLLRDQGNDDQGIIPTSRHTDHRGISNAEQHRGDQEKLDTIQVDNEIFPEQDVPEGENESWRKFIFGESELDVETALEVARKETAKALRPPVASSNTDSEHTSEDSTSREESSSETVEAGVVLGKHCSIQQHGHSTNDTSSMVSASDLATAGLSSPDPLSEPFPFLDFSEASVHTDRATVSSSTKSSSTALHPVDKSPRRRRARTCSTNEAVAGSPIARQRRPAHEQGEADGGFKFAPPKLFKGKQSSHIDENRQITLSAPQMRGRIQTHRRQKRTGDGRASIRKLPNFSSDPIEEFEEDILSAPAPKPFLFNSLDVQRDP